MMPGLERVTFVEAAINCIIRLEGEADTLARLLSEALQLAAASSDPRWVGVTKHGRPVLRKVRLVP